MFNAEKFTKNKRLKTAIEFIMFLIGAVIYSFGVSAFITPANISVGGFTGISIILNRIFSLPIGTLIIVLNIPMFIICAKTFGLKFITKTVAGVILTSVLIDVLSAVQPFGGISMELSALCGGILQGVGLGMIYRNGYTTGGTDLVIWLLKLKFPHMTSGVILFFLDSAVVGTAAFIFRDPQSIIYSAITIYVYTKVIDTILGAGDRANLAIIISENYNSIAAEISSRLGRGATLLEGKGWFSSIPKKVILCVVHRSQIYTLKTLVNEIDSTAFFVLADAREVIGEGFKRA